MGRVPSHVIYTSEFGGLHWYKWPYSLAIINRNTAPGYDGLMSEHFQFASHRVKIELAIVLQAFMRHGFLPDSLMLTMIVPIMKSKNGDITSKGNYRPIAIATVISKILEMCIQKRLQEYLWTTDNQFAYKKGHSTDMCVFILKEMIRFYRKHRTPVYVCFLDASKAFDCVNHWNYLMWWLNANVLLLS